MMSLKGGFSPLVSEIRRQLRRIFVDNEKSFVSKSVSAIVGRSVVITNLKLMTITRFVTRTSC